MPSGRARTASLTGSTGGPGATPAGRLRRHHRADERPVIHEPRQARCGRRRCRRFGERRVRPGHVPTVIARGIGAADASSSPSRSVATLPPDRITATRSPSRNGTAPVRTAARAADPAGSRTCLRRSSANFRPPRIVASSTSREPSRYWRATSRASLPTIGRAEPVRDADRRHRHGLPRREPPGERLGADRLHAVDAHGRPRLLERNGQTPPSSPPPPTPSTTTSTSGRSSSSSSPQEPLPSSTSGWS